MEYDGSWCIFAFMPFSISYKFNWKFSFMVYPERLNKPLFLYTDLDFKHKKCIRRALFYPAHRENGAKFRKKSGIWSREYVAFEKIGMWGMKICISSNFSGITRMWAFHKISYHCWTKTCAWSIFGRSLVFLSI